MHRFFLPADCFHADTITLPAPIAHQIQHVLRLRLKDQIVVLDPGGTEYTAELFQLGAGAALARVVASQPARGEPHVRLALYPCLVQREKFEWVLQKCTEVGVCAITPVISSRSLVRRWSREDDRKLERWQKIVQEAAEQSQRGRVPTLHPALSLEQAFQAAARENELCLIPWEGEHAVSLSQALDLPSKPASIALFIGPEGGFSEEEIQSAQRQGVQAVTLGRRILRAETAAVVAAALVLFALGEME